MKKVHDVTLLAARILLVSVFVFSGFFKVIGPAKIMQIMAAAGIPMVHAALVLTILIEFGCSLLVVVGYKARWAALAIILWFIPATIIFHIPTHQTLEVLKNLGLIGGLLVIVDCGPGAFSIDGILSPARPTAARSAA